MPTAQHHSSRLCSSLASKILGLIHGVWDLWTVLDLTWGMDVENGFEG